MKEQHMIGYLSNGTVPDKTVQEIRAMSQDEADAYCETLDRLALRLWDQEEITIQAEYVGGYQWMVGYIHDANDYDHHRRMQIARKQYNRPELWPLEYLYVAQADKLTSPDRKGFWIHECSIAELEEMQDRDFALYEMMLEAYADKVHAMFENNPEQYAAAYAYVLCYRYIATILAITPRRAIMEVEDAVS